MAGRSLPEASHRRVRIRTIPPPEVPSAGARHPATPPIEKEEKEKSGRLRPLRPYSFGMIVTLRYGSSPVLCVVTAGCSRNSM